MKITFLRASILICAVAVSVWSQAIEIRVTGEHLVARDDTAESAKQFASMDATRKAIQQAVTRLQAAAEVKNLELKANQLEAFVAATLNPQEQSSPSAAPKEGSLYRIDVVAHLDTNEAARRFAKLRKDQDAVRQLVELWSQIEQSQGRRADLKELRVKYLAAQVTAALAKTEETLVSARASSAEGKAKAKQLADAALALGPDVADAHYAMGDVFMDIDQPQSAEAEYRKALAINQDSSSGHIKLADALRNQEKVVEVAAELREALRIAPNSVQAHTDLGAIFAAQGKNQEAMSEYREAIRLDPDFIDVHNNLAIFLARQGRIPEAVAEFREIVRIDSDSVLGYYNLGIALADMDKDDESAAAFREVVRINPNHYNARFDLADLFRLEGKYDDAVRQFREYIRLAPDTPQNQRNIRRAKQFIEEHENR